MKVTVIGAGNMGGALAKGWLKAEQAGREGAPEITVADRSETVIGRMKEEFPNLRYSFSNTEAVKDADIVVIAVKPWLVEIVVAEIKDALDYSKQSVISIAAGVTTDKLSDMFRREGTDVELPNIHYVMPNIAAEYGESMSFVTAAKHTAKEATAAAEQLFKHVGSVNVCEERLLAAGMMMAGCGIAYVMRFLRAMMEGGVEMGFYPAEAQQIAMQVMKGATTLLEETGLHPEAAIDKVTTPGGVTIKGLNELDHAGFNSAVIRCLKAGLK